MKTALFSDSSLRILLVHYWLTGFAGGEKVLSALADLFPTADILTHVVTPAGLDDSLRKHTINTTFISRMPFAAKLRKAYLPLMPLALEAVDVNSYDLIISSESGPAKGVIPSPKAVHVCYCHSPMRYIWDLRHEYLRGKPFLYRCAANILGHYLRFCDVSSASRVDQFVANSNHTASRIEAWYGKPSHVVYPPVDTDKYAPGTRLGDYYLVVGRLVKYKGADLAIKACDRLDRPLIIVGDGPERSALASCAGPNVQFLGAVSDKRLAGLYAGCKALLFPGEEDFGLTVVEAMASGRPVIAYGAGGALDSVVDGETGLFFQEPTVDSLVEAITRFEKLSFDPLKCVESASRFDIDHFKSNMLGVVKKALG